MSEFLLAEAGVRQLHARYSDAVWRKDYAAFGDCFTEDAEWRVGGYVFRGRAEIVAAIERLMVPFIRVLITFRTPILEAGKGSASGRTYVTEQNGFKDGRPGSSIGTYYEHFVDGGDRWRRSWAFFELHYMGTADLDPEKFFDRPDYGPPPAMPPRDAQTVTSLKRKPDGSV